MPKKRKVNVRKVQARLFILCEGEKTEPNYFDKFIEDCRLSPLVEVKVISTKSNTNKELVGEAKSFKDIEGDQVWVVVDKDGYTKHPEAFNTARDNGIHIAFSSISFEFWILLHFEYTTRAFQKSADIISHLKHQHGFLYRKNDQTVFAQTRDSLETAMTNAGKVRKYQAGAGGKIYDWNSYTDVDLLIEAIQNLRKSVS